MTERPLCEHCGRPQLSPALHDLASGADCGLRSVAGNAGMVPLTEWQWRAFEIMHAANGRAVRPTQIGTGFSAARQIIYDLRKSLRDTRFCIELPRRHGIGYRLIDKESSK